MFHPRLIKRVHQLRDRIATRSAELQITTDHDSTGHYYVSADKKYPSVSAFLKLIKDPSLNNYANNRMADYIRENYKAFTSDTIDFHLDRARRAGTDIMTNAGEIGTAAHAVREKWFEEWIRNGDIIGDMQIPVGVDSSVIACARSMKTLIDKYSLIPIACELSLIDHNLEVGGQLDDLMLLPEKDGKSTLCLVDVKTSNIANKTVYYYQVALYYHMFVALYKVRPHKVYIAHLSKDNDQGKLIEIPNIRQVVKESKHLIGLKKSYDRIEASKVKKPIIYNI